MIIAYALFALPTPFSVHCVREQDVLVHCLFLHGAGGLMVRAFFITLMSLSTAIRRGPSRLFTSFYQQIMKVKKEQ